MLQSLRNRRNRKGFTLAELLIVVAIIAVLVAIAVPLFVGALNDAEKRVGEADCRAVRGAAVTEILLDSQRSSSEQKGYGTTGPWYAHAIVDGSGEVTELKIRKTEADTSWNLKEIKTGDGVTAIGTTAAYQKATNGGYEVLVKIEALTVTE